MAVSRIVWADGVIGEKLRRINPRVAYLSLSVKLHEVRSTIAAPILQGLELYAACRVHATKVR